MQKYKTAIYQTVTKITEGIALWYTALALDAGLSTVMNFVAGFAFLWLGTDIVIWAYDNIARPSAQAIYESSK